jgi:predicted nucleic acid-binding protein
MPGSFFDTNVLLYLVSRAPEKADRTERLIAAGGIISVQVLNEVANVARRKMRMSWDETRTLLGTLRGLLPVVPVTLETHVAGTVLAERYGFAVYDAMIAAAAMLAGCDVLWSEDMQHGMSVDGRLRIVNPFVGEMRPPAYGPPKPID